MDRHIVERAQHGDRDAFAILARDRSDELYVLAQRILRDADRAEDALQQALVTAWRELPRLRDSDRFEAWIRRILVHACYAEHSRSRRWAASVRTLSVEPGSVDRGTLTVDDRDELERGFLRLSPEHRAVLAMHHYLGLSAAEIGATLGVPTGTVRSRLHYAHLAMRAALDAVERGVAPMEGTMR